MRIKVVSLKRYHQSIPVKSVLAVVISVRITVRLKLTLNALSVATKIMQKKTQVLILHRQGMPG